MFKTETAVTSTLPVTKAPARITEIAAQGLARTIFIQLQESGCQTKDVIAVSSQLIALVTSALAGELDAAH